MAYSAKGNADVPRSDFHFSTQEKIHLLAILKDLVGHAEANLAIAKAIDTDQGTPYVVLASISHLLHSLNAAHAIMSNAWHKGAGGNDALPTFNGQPAKKINGSSNGQAEPEGGAK